MLLASETGRNGLPSWRTCWLTFDSLPYLTSALSHLHSHLLPNVLFLCDRLLDKQINALHSFRQSFGSPHQTVADNSFRHGWQNNLQIMLPKLALRTLLSL
jgi:hypothetical protein